MSNNKESNTPNIIKTQRKDDINASNLAKLITQMNGDALKLDLEDTLAKMKDEMSKF